MSITVQEFFPDKKANLTGIKWAHKTNSKEQLAKVLQLSDIHMIEADVLIGKLKDSKPEDQPIPIMAHPPVTESDLTLEEFVKKVVDNKKMGMKLDFKTIEAAQQGVTIIKRLGNLTVPVWLNADILKGPVNITANETAPVDAKAFLAAAASLPQALLSIGWTTRLEETTKNVTTAKYTSEQIKEMVKTLQDSKNNQSVTYPVRACYAANDVEVLKTLLTDTKANNPTLTIWSSEGDKVDAVKLSTLIKTVGLDKVYVDVPPTLWQKLNLRSSAFTAKNSLSVMLASVFVALFAIKLL